MSDVRFTVTYAPEGATPRVWPVDVLDGLKASELIAIKKATGGSINGVQALIQGIQELDFEALKALVWVLLKRDLSTIPFESLDFPLGAVKVEGEPEPDDVLMRKLIAYEEQGTLNEAGRAKLGELREAGVVPADAEVDDPKA